MLEFGIGIFSGTEGVGDVSAKDAGVSLAKAMGGDLGGGLGHVERGSGIGVGGFWGIRSEEGFESLEELALFRLSRGACSTPSARRALLARELRVGLRPFSTPC
jgi:hypothetical protein